LAIGYNQSAEKACKGTTKNAHEQIFLEKNVFLSEILVFAV
jgi:hypothetical protein